MSPLEVVVMPFIIILLALFIYVVLEWVMY